MKPSKPRQEGTLKTIVAKNRQDGSIKEFSAEAIMIATGRVSNADRLKPEKTGVKLDEHGFIKVNEYLETSKKNIFAFGDAIGKQMFKHVANYEAGIAWHNAIHDHKVKMDFSAAPHAVFHSSPGCLCWVKGGRSQTEIQNFGWQRTHTRTRLWVQHWVSLKAS